MAEKECNIKRETKNKSNKYKTVMNVVDINLTVSYTLSVNGLNTPIKRDYQGGSKTRITYGNVLQI